jgi:hypothetical protein
LTVVSHHTIRGVATTLAACAIGVSACHRGPVLVGVRATFPDSAPLADVTITAFPYDPQRLLDSLAAADSTPRPDFSALEQELMAFQRPETPEADPAAIALSATRDSARRLADSLQHQDRRAPGYAGAYARFRRLYGRLTERAAALQGGLHGPLADVRALAERAGRAADSLRSWEAKAYEGFDSAAAREVARLGREPAADITDAAGWATFSLPPGSWHLMLRIPDTVNPFVEHVWNVPITVSGFPVRTVMLSANARTEWRH